MKVLYKWLPRIYMISTFIWIIWYLIWKYSKIVVVESTTSTMPIPILIIIVILIMIVTVGGVIIMLLSWWETIKEDKFSFYTFAPISVLLLGTIVLSKLLITKVKILVEINAAQFMNDLIGYNSSMTILVYILLSGLVIGAIGKVFE